MKYAFLALLFVLLWSGAARADEDSLDPSRFPLTRVNVTATLGVGDYMRSATLPQSEGGFSLGAEVRVHPYGPSGVVVAYGYGGALFGPTVTTLDIGYSFRPVAPQKLHGVTGALYVDVGPSFGWVTPTSNESTHHDLGGRAALTADLQIYGLTLGAQFAFHGGIPVDPTPQSPSQFESCFMLGARAGFVFDLGEGVPR